MIPLISAIAAVFVIVVGALIVLMVFAGAKRARFSRAESRAIAKRAALIIGLWLGASALAAASGALADFEARPPRMMFVLGGAIVTFALATRGPTFRRILDAMPRAWLVALQSMRIPIELGLWSLLLAGRFPVHLTFEGRNYDVLVGLSAPVVAWLVSRGHLGRRALIVWNVAALGFLANIVGMAITTIPGPLHLPWPGVPNTIVAEWPYVWLPGFLVPVALFGHVLSLRQLRSASAQKPIDRPAGAGRSMRVSAGDESA